jgi:hypothetical protein
MGCACEIEWEDDHAVPLHANGVVAAEARMNAVRHTSQDVNKRSALRRTFADQKRIPFFKNKIWGRENMGSVLTFIHPRFISIQNPAPHG